MKLIYSVAEKKKLKSVCVGHSLGSHVCGFTGKTKQLDVIIGIDPAGPQFENHRKEHRLDKGDADFVEVRHTDIGGFGIVKPIGDVDIYFNGGRTQPRCDHWNNEIGCSHFFLLWGLPQLWERGAKEGICRATMRCPNMTIHKINRGIW